MTDRMLRKRKNAEPSNNNNNNNSENEQEAAVANAETALQGTDESCRRQFKAECSESSNNASHTQTRPSNVSFGSGLAARPIMPIHGDAAAVSGFPGWPAMPFMYAVVVTTTTSFVRHEEPPSERKASLRSHSHRKNASSPSDAFPGLTFEEEQQLRAAHAAAHQTAVQQAVAQASAFQTSPNQAMFLPGPAPKALTREEIERRQLSRCSICMDDFAVGQMVSSLSCGHISHHPCLSQWLRHNHSCPQCRSQL